MKIAVIVHPNARKPRIEKDMFGGLHLYVHEPPLEGKANRAAILALAEYFHTKRAKIMLLSGEKSKSKLFEITE
jgi:uncharacterized protein YggU (UPF0235/DUF167 family)